MNYFSICAILKNEGLYLREWIEHYIKQGTEKFFLYNNESTDNPKEVLKEFADKIVWHEVRGKAQQGVAYNHCVKEYKDRSEWMAFLDIDEMLYSGKDKVFVETLKREYDQPIISGIAVHWLLFGSSGHIDYSPEPVTRRFIMRAEEVNPHVKSIMRMRDTYSMGNNVHTFRAHGAIVNEHFSELGMEYANRSPATADILRINHYVTRSKAECVLKCNRGRGDTGQQHGEGFFESHDRNDVQDIRIWEVL